ncbi:MAG: hypothetical protein GYA21_00470 [Myxococcales bacterium]|nr:hypothetical protein [Myxococcales bacterium]
MKEIALLREFLRAALEAHLRPFEPALKKVEYLKFIGADRCPECGEEADFRHYVRQELTDGSFLEQYHCPHCGLKLYFPRDVLQ